MPCQQLASPSGGDWTCRELAAVGRIYVSRPCLICAPKQLAMSSGQKNLEHLICMPGLIPWFGSIADAAFLPVVMMGAVSVLGTASKA